MNAAPRTAARAAFPLLPVRPRAMTRCECAGVAFAEIARRMAAYGRTAEEVMTETGVGGMCTGCVPDLKTFLTRFGQSPD